jgi:hypothetical protein
MEPVKSQDGVSPRAQESELSAEAIDPVIEVYKRDLDFTITERNLRLSAEERLQQLVNATRFIARFRPLVPGNGR